MFLYSVAIRLYVLLVFLVSPFNRKARKLIEGRRSFFKQNPPQLDHSYIWFHCASLGEFEQGRPLIEKIKTLHPDKKILLSFFSSSGYEVRKNYEYVDRVIYLPFDFGTNANKFFGTFNINAAIFVKYDVWPGYLNELIERKIPSFLISATFRNDHFYFKWYGKFMKDRLKKMNRIFTQDKDSWEILNKNGFTNAVQCGDLRVDRVIQIHTEDQKLEELEKFAPNKNCFVFGSVYAGEIDLIKRFSSNVQQKVIIAPHNVERSNIDFFLKYFPESVLWSNFKDYSDHRVLIIDNIGLLNKVYKYCSGAYIGGGFGKGIHNILEPTVWGLPIFIGPNYKKFPEADSLIQSGMVFSENKPDDLAKLMCSNMKELEEHHFNKISLDWFRENSGSTSLIYKKLSAFF